MLEGAHLRLNKFSFEAIVFLHAPPKIAYFVGDFQFPETRVGFKGRFRRVTLGIVRGLNCKVIAGFNRENTTRTRSIMPDQLIPTPKNRKGNR